MKLIPAFLIAITFLSCKDKVKEKLLTSTAIDYPSGSALVKHNKQLYLTGDDANYIMILDEDFKKKDSIRLYDFEERRIPKDVKADPEGAAVFLMNNRDAMLIVGSGSTILRSGAWLIDLELKDTLSFSLDTIYNRIKNEGVTEINIEGIAAIPGGFLLANRGNLSYKKNKLIFLPGRFWQKQDSVDIHISSLGFNADSTSFSGVSGIEYSKRTDRLYVTLSTEETHSTHGDGKIGKSYLWIINDISRKKNYEGINPSRIIDLELLDAKFKEQKIESVCILDDGRRSVTLALVSDDDKGGSTMFKIVVDDVE